MTTGEYIRKCRTGDNIFGTKWTQEELGKMLIPPVNRAAVYKWETGLVTGIKKHYIEQLAAIFGIEPGELMCFEYDEEKISQEVKTIENVQDTFGTDAVQILQYFMQLNETGRQKALDDICDLTEISKYTEKV
jgi:transcriptional regulator with XRE-family HTH domain